MTAGATCDTSVLVPALVSWHHDHEQARMSVVDQVTALPAHVLIETYSVLTRLPAPHRIAPVDAAAAIAVTIGIVALPADSHLDLITEMSRHGIRGGAVYDALIAATARHHDLLLLTRDRRARAVYEAVGVQYALS